MNAVVPGLLSMYLGTATVPLMEAEVRNGALRPWLLVLDPWSLVLGPQSASPFAEVEHRCMPGLKERAGQEEQDPGSSLIESQC